jgi:hypothetical protein
MSDVMVRGSTRPNSAGSASDTTCSSIEAGTQGASTNSVSRPHRFGERGRKFGVTLCSLVVTAACVLFVVAPESVAYSVSETKTKGPLQTVVVFGRIVLRGIAGVRFHLYGPRHVDDNQGRIRVDFFSASDGTYRFSASMPEGTYSLSVRIPKGGHAHFLRFEIEPGTAYKINVHAVHRSLFAFVPVTSY